MQVAHQPWIGVPVHSAGRDAPHLLRRRFGGLVPRVARTPLALCLLVRIPNGGILLLGGSDACDLRRSAHDGRLYGELDGKLVIVRGLHNMFGVDGRGGVGDVVLFMLGFNLLDADALILGLALRFLVLDLLVVCEVLKVLRVVV